MMLLALTLSTASPAHDPRCKSERTLDLIACADADLASADAALNAQWKKARTKVASDEKYMDAGIRAGNGGLTYGQALLASERAWLNYRDAQCRLSTYVNFGGRELPIFQSGCRANLSKQRTQELKDFTEGR
jgi:uncharacterized protein YecT (DUF1311 family)